MQPSPLYYTPYFLFTHLRRRFDDDVAAIFDNFQRNITDAVFIIGHLDIEKNSSDLFLQVIRKKLFPEILCCLLGAFFFTTGRRVTAPSSSQSAVSKVTSSFTPLNISSRERFLGILCFAI